MNFSSDPDDNPRKNRKRINDDIIERKLRNIIDGNIPKSITVDGKRYYISRADIQYVRNQEE